MKPIIPHCLPTNIYELTCTKEMLPFIDVPLFSCLQLSVVLPKTTLYTPILQYCTALSAFHNPLVSMPQKSALKPLKDQVKKERTLPL